MYHRQYKKGERKTINCKCTIVLPVYNGKDTLCRCLDTINSQTYKNFLIYAIDDGSTDNSYEILNSYSEKDDRYVLFKKENGGAAQARNYVLGKIETKYVFFLDSDDWIDSNTLEILIGLSEKYDADIVQSNFEFVFNSQKSYIPKALFKEEQVIEKKDFKLIYKKIFKTINLNHIAHTLFRTESIRGMILNENLRTGEDVYFMIDALKRTNRFVYTQKALYHYFVRNNSLTSLSVGISEKIRCNYLVSKKIASSLKDWGMDYPLYYFMAYFRLAVISCSKIFRVSRNLLQGVQIWQLKKKV